MKRRPYNRALREAAAEVTRRRIVEAAVALHAERGPSATSHALLARRAGVSVPTVYKHFPTPDDIIPDCTGHVLERSPVRLDEALLDGIRDVPSRLRTLAGALYRLHEYLAPWMRWPADLATFPTLEDVHHRMRERRRKLVLEALRPGFRKAPPDGLVDLVDTLLDFPSWRGLTVVGRSTEQAIALVGDALELLYRGQRR